MKPTQEANTKVYRWFRLERAIAYAFEAHSEQTRKGSGTPYIAHLMAVSSLVLEYGGDPEQAQAGMLHDVLEDCGLEHEARIFDQFGPRVARIVIACTDWRLPDAPPPWHERKASYLSHLERQPQDVLLVSACDKLHNARAILSDLHAHGLAVFDRFAGGRPGVLWYYGQLAAIYQQRIPGPLAAELARAVEDIEMETDALLAFGALEAAAAGTDITAP